jgi:hypothetical protein
MLDDSAILANLADEFTARIRAGELPAVEDYAVRHPDLAERIRALFPTLLLLEGMARGGEGPLAAGVDLTPGSAFGPYVIVGEIGRGGMGIVYEAMHQTLQRRVALKVLPLHGPQAATQLERFLREARTAAGLHHTNIVPVFDVGQVNGVPYFAMQRIQGRGLDAILSERETSTPTDYRWVAELGVQAAEALAFAHQRGVVHRDIKPSNLLLDDEGVLWVTDFGLARSQGDASLTHTGQLVGTPRYMSPEQAGAASNPIDHRTDLYSLGATLYELLTGRPPVSGTTPQEVLQSLLHREPISPRRLDRKIPRDLETLLLKAMARRPEDRYASAQALADDLRRYLDHRPLSARRVGLVGRSLRWARRNPVVTTLSAVLALLMLSFLMISAQQALRAQREMRRALEAEMMAREAMHRALEAESRRHRQEAQGMIDQGLSFAARGEQVLALHWLARPLVERLILEAGEETRLRRRLATFERYGSGNQPAPVPEGTALLGPMPERHLTGAVILSEGDRHLLLHQEAGKRGGPLQADLRDATGQVVRTFPLDEGQTVGLFTSNGRYLAGLNPDNGSLTLFETATGTVVGRVKQSTSRKANQRWVLGEDGRQIYRLDADRNQIEVLEATTGNTLRTVVLGPARSTVPLGEIDLAVSDEGQLLAALARGTMSLCDDRTGDLLWTRQVPDATRLWFDPQVAQYLGAVGGSYGLVTGEKTGLRFWSAANGEPMTVTLAETAGYRILSWDNSAEQLILGNQMRVLVWDLVDGRPLTPPLSHPHEVVAARLSADGNTLRTLDTLGTLRVWDLSPVTTPALDIIHRLERRFGVRVIGGSHLVPIAEEEK